MYFYIAVYSRLITFSLLKFFCSRLVYMSCLPTSCYNRRWIGKGTKIDPFPDISLLCSKNENYLYFRLKPIWSNLSVWRSFCVMLTITSKSHLITHSHFQWREYFICWEQIYCVSIFLKTSAMVLGIPLCEVIWRLDHFCQSAVADPMKKGRPYFDILQTKLLLSTLQLFNLIIYSLNMYRRNDYYDTMCSNWQSRIKG